MKSPYSFCAVAVAPLRESASDASEMISQLLFGEPVEVLEIQQQWRKVRSLLDNYEGWTDFKLLLPITEKEFRRWSDEFEFLGSATAQIQSEDGQILVPMGSCVSLQSNVFHIGPHKYECELSHTVPDSNRVEQMIETALLLLNTPYLWGGKSSFGIDCSGFMQTVARTVGFNLPRDAYQQVDHGIDVDYTDRERGDFVFFVNANEKVHHVGIYLGNDEIIHAHGKVRIDTLTSDGIIRRFDNELSHRYYGIKRLM